MDRASGIIFYLTLWFPAEYRARIVGYFMAAIPLSTVIGAPISGALLYLHGGLGLAGWQWLFIIEAVPATILAGVVFFYLTDRPADAAWLAPDERIWLAERLALEQRQRQAVHDYSVMQALVNPRVLGLSLVYFGAVATNYGLSFFLPQIVKGFGLNTFLTTLVSATPYVVGLVGMVWWGRRSDRVAERRFHTTFPLFIAAAGIAVSTALDDPLLKMISLCLAGFGIFACLPVFWTLPTAFLSGAAAAAGIAVINSIGNLAGFAGAVCDGVDQGPYRQLRRRALVAGGARHHCHGNRAHPRPRRRGRACPGCGRVNALIVGSSLNRQSAVAFALPRPTPPDC
jgi:MFS family permease